eukprot:GGOE01049125.1.p1 GENE.GGOE01049125.1~~GGOE01049125.1.p1  ORF type:complete len:100 (+),score=4.10 GGOE01049125.1:144-443(+)
MGPDFSMGQRLDTQATYMRESLQMENAIWHNQHSTKTTQQLSHGRCISIQFSSKMTGSTLIGSGRGPCTPAPPMRVAAEWVQKGERGGEEDNIHKCPMI